MTSTPREIIRSFILREFLPDVEADELSPTTPLISGGILNSIATVRMVMFLEEQFGIQMQPHEINADNLETIDRIAELVRRKQAGA